MIVESFLWNWVHERIEQPGRASPVRKMALLRKSYRSLAIFAVFVLGPDLLYQSVPS